MAFEAFWKKEKASRKRLLGCGSMHISVRCARCNVVVGGRSLNSFLESIHHRVCPNGHRIETAFDVYEHIVRVVR